MQSDATSAVIIGGGFSGLIVLYHLVEKSAGPARYVVFEPRQKLGYGIAYSTANPRHLLNVSAIGMSAFQDDPAHFLRWLASSSGQQASAALGVKQTWSEQDFVPRPLYARYLDALMEQLLATARAKNIEIQHKRDVVLSVTATRDGFLVTGQNTPPVKTQTIAYCVGNIPPVELKTGNIIHDVWGFNFEECANETRPIAILGSGLTSIDVLIALRAAGYAGKVSAFSRHGFLPLVHDAADPRQYPSQASTIAAQPLRLSGLLRQFRLEVRKCAGHGLSWQKVFEMWRPHAAALWQALAVADRKRFIRRLLPLWNVHRHRMAPEVGAFVVAQICAGGFDVMSGYQDISDTHDGVQIVRNGASLHFARLFDCRGFGGNVMESPHALTQKLLADRVLTAHESGWGVRLNPLFNPQPSAQNMENFFIVGPLAAGEYLELTAVPELRVMAEKAASQMLASLEKK